MARCLFKGGLATRVWAAQWTASFYLSAPTGSAQLQRVAPSKVTHLPGRSTPGDWVISRCESPATWPNSGHLWWATLAPERPARLAKSLSNLHHSWTSSSQFCSSPFLSSWSPQKTIIDPKPPLIIFFWIIRPAAPHNTPLSRTACSLNKTSARTLAAGKSSHPSGMMMREDLVLLPPMASW